MNTVSSALANNLRAVFFGGNWSVSDMQSALEDTPWTLAVANNGNANSIADLVMHIGYYLRPAREVLEGKPLVGKDADSFKTPSITSQAEWDSFVRQTMEAAEALAVVIERQDDDSLFKNFHGTTYGTVFRNLMGVIEHTHYHLGQIVLLKKMAAVAPSSVGT